MRSLTIFCWRIAPAIASRSMSCLVLGGSFLYELVQRTIHGVGDVNLFPCAHRDRVSLAEFAQTFSGFSRHGQYIAVEVQFQDLAREAVHHIYVLVTDLNRAGQAGVLQLFNKRSVLVENLNSLVLPVRNP